MEMIHSSRPWPIYHQENSPWYAFIGCWTDPGVDLRALGKNKMSATATTLLISFGSLITIIIVL
jgi:hypothetical protein